MSRKIDNYEITRELLSSTLTKMAKDAKRLNRAKGLDTVYIRGDELVRESASGEIEVIKKVSKNIPITSVLPLH
jgi:hypothetical protein